MLERPFIVYADTECSLIKTDDPNKVARHVVNSACFYFVCTYDHSKTECGIMLEKIAYMR